MNPKYHRILLVILLVMATLFANDYLAKKPSSPLRNDDYKVVKIYDGDTIEVQTDNGLEKVRFAGINAPETMKPGTDGMCMADEATDMLRELIGTSMQVTLVPDRLQTNRDRYGRLLRYVYNDKNTDVSIELVKLGLAPAIRGFDYDRKDKYQAAESEAKSAGLGVWSEFCKKFKLRVYPGE